VTKPLQNLRILVTRPKHQAEELSFNLRQWGAEVVELPLLTINEPPSWEPFEHAFASIDKYSWVVFASANAVWTTYDRLKTKNWLGKLNKVQVASIGPAASRMLTSAGVSVSHEPSKYIAENLVSEFPGYPSEIAGVRVLWPKGDVGRTYIKDALEKVGAYVDIVNCYSSGGPEHPREAGYELRQLLSRKEVDIVTFTSSETVRNFHKLLAAGGPINDYRTNVSVAVIGPETARTAGQLIGGADIQAEEYSVAGLVTALVNASYAAGIKREKN
jgi:uroporphyrinogen III methyltransferase / synthase